MTQVVIDGTKNMSAPFVASPQCSGYGRMVDALDVYVTNTTFALNKGAGVQGGGGGGRC